MHEKLVFNNVSHLFLFIAHFSLLRKTKNWLFFQHKIIVYIDKTFCRDTNCMCIITAVLNKIVAEISYFDIRPIENVKLGSVKGQP